MSTITLRSGETKVHSLQADGNDYIFAGISQGNPPVLSFINGSFNFLDSLSISAAYPSQEYGEIIQGAQRFVEVTNGINVTHGNLVINQKPGALFVLDGTSQLSSGTLSVSAGHGGSLLLDGKIVLMPGQASVLDLRKEHLIGDGTIIQQGESDTTKVGQVDAGVHFVLTGGALDIDKPLSFQGTIGPIAGSSSAAMGIFGHVSVYNAFDTVKATFDPSDGILSLLDSRGHDLGNVRFSGDVSGVHLSKFSDPRFSYIGNHRSR